MRVNTPTQTFKVFFNYDVIEQENGNLVYTGDTICKILTEDEKEQLAFGHSSCDPYDQFVKATGRKIALTRALKQLKADRITRFSFWKTLFPQYFR